MRPSARLAPAVLASLSVIAMVACDSTQPLPPPAAPSALVAIANSASQVTLSWDLPTGDVTELRIERAAGAAAFGPLTTVEPSNVFVDSGLTPSTFYRYQVQACNTAGCSAFAAAVTVNTPGLQGGATFGIRTPILPVALVDRSFQAVVTTHGTSGGAMVWSLVGALPQGLSFGSDGRFSGSPTRAGVYPVTIRVTAGGQTAQKAFSLRVVADDPTRFNITRLDVAPMSAQVAELVQAAVRRWESAIIGDLPEDRIPNGYFRASHCGGFGDIVNGTTADDVVIFVNIAAIDGPGRVVGQAGPCGIRDANTQTLVGLLTLDAEDMQRLSPAQVTNVAFHEIGHVLGYGTLWDQNQSLIQGSDTDPRYGGVDAVREWRTIGGSGEVPLETEGGSGTALGHWRESIFDGEIMTGYTERAGAAEPLSRVTLGSMADLGYRVDYRASDAFQLRAQAPGLMAPQLVEPSDIWGWEEPLPDPILVIPHTSR